MKRLSPSKTLTKLDAYCRKEIQEIGEMEDEYEQGVKSAMGSVLAFIKSCREEKERKDVAPHTTKAPRRS